MSCLPHELSVKEITSKLIEKNFFMSEEYTSDLLVSSIKKFIEQIPGIQDTPFTEATDTFILYKNNIGAFLVEFHNGCTNAFLGMDLNAFQSFKDFLNSIM